MIRDRFYCPECQMEEVPVLIATPWYNCPDCHTISPRKDMLTKRTAKLHLAGTNAGRSISTTQLATGTMVDDLQATLTLTSNPFASRAGDRLVICVASVANSAAPTSISLSQGNMTLAIASDNGVTFSSIWYTNAADIAADTPVDSALVSWGATGPAAAALTVTRLTGAVGASILDRTKASSGGGIAVSSGNTLALAANNETAIACVASQETLNASTVISWTSPFSSKARTGTSTSGVSDVVLSLGADTLAGGVINARATLADAPAWVIAVATFKAA